MELTNNDIIKLFQLGFEKSSSRITLLAMRLARRTDVVEDTLKRALDEWQGDLKTLTYLFGQLVSSGFGPELLPLMDHADLGIRRAAITALAGANTSYEDNKLAELLLDYRYFSEYGVAESLFDQDPWVRHKALEKLRTSRPDSFSKPREYTDLQWHATNHSEEWLERIGELEVDQFIDLLAATFLAYGSFGARWCVPKQKRILEVIAQAGTPKAVNRLQEIEGDERNLIAKFKDEASTGSGETSAEQTIQAYTKEYYPPPRITHIMVKIAGARCLPFFLEGLSDRRATVRADAVHGLTSIGSESVPSLIEYLQKPADFGRVDAVNALGWIHDPKSADAVAALLKDSDADIQRAALIALGRIPSQVSWDALSASARHPSRHIRAWTAKALRDCSGPQTHALLANLLTDEHHQVRRAAAKALLGWVHERDDHQGLDALVKALGDPNEEIRRTVSDGLGSLRERLLRFVDRNTQHPTHRVRSEIEETGVAYSREGGSHQEPLPTLEIPEPVTDEVKFILVAPAEVVQGAPAPLDVYVERSYINLETLLANVTREYGAKVRHRSKGPVEVPRGAVMSVRVSIPALEFEDEDAVLWNGSRGNASFVVPIPANAAIGVHDGTAMVDVNGERVARVRFVIEVGKHRGGPADMTSSMKLVRSAFASYASEDREKVLARVQGMQKVLPDLDVFLDVVSLRSGEKWKERLEDEILKRDAFYLFWSEAAAKSTWVDFEWRLALRARGEVFISPVPLSSPKLAPPPTELSSLHFGDWTLTVS